ncbi:MAG: PspC domain-containing protein [Candidatus Aenigmarchaeota archaeon]|nr:PspC domain-containing protein [Candidatus Aenigmarchaeota archaeon]
MAPKKRLYRSKDEVMISGVCGGLAEYFDVDPTIVRLLWVFLTLGSMGTGLIIYLIMALIVPKNPQLKKK